VEKLTNRLNAEQVVCLRIPQKKLVFRIRTDPFSLPARPI